MTLLADIPEESLMARCRQRKGTVGGRRWLHDFLPDLSEGGPANLLEPAIVGDRSDPKIIHLDGLNLSRAWCMWSIAASLPQADAARSILSEAALRHAGDALAHIASGQYEGEHWLASFAVYMLSTRYERGGG